MTAAALALLLAATAAPATEPPVAVSARPGASEVTVGERFTVEVEASGPPGARFVFPEQAGGERIEMRAVADGPASSPQRMTYEAAVFALDEVAVPPVPVRWELPDGRRGETASAPVPLSVRSLLPKDEAEQTLADVRPPLGVRVAPVFWAGLALLVLAVAAAVAFALGRRRNGVAPAAVSTPELAPDVEARGALDHLAAEGLLARGELRGFYIRLAAIAKRYLERRLDAPVLEMTSAEVSTFLREHRHGGEMLATVRDVTAAADLVKFARGRGEAEIAERQLAAVRGLIDGLERRLAAERAAADAVAAGAAAGERRR